MSPFLRAPLTAFAITLATLAWAGDEFDPDLMQTVDDTNKDLASNLALAEAAPAKSNIATLDELLAMVEKHYTEQNTADAVKITQDSRALLQQISTLVDAKEFDAANAKSAEFSKTCKACHRVYKKS